MANITSLSKIEKIKIETSSSEISEKIGMEILKNENYDSNELQFSVILPNNKSRASLIIEAEEIVCLFTPTIDKDSICECEIEFEDNNKITIYCETDY